MTNQKYLKYKLKYLNLKKKLLGGNKSKKEPRGCNKPGAFCVDFKDKCKTSTKGTKSNNCECKPSGNCVPINKIFSQNLKKLYDTLHKLQVNLINTHNNLEDLDKLQIKDYNISSILASFKTFQEGIDILHQNLVNTPVEFQKSTEEKADEVVEEKVDEVVEEKADKVVEEKADKVVEENTKPAKGKKKLFNAKKIAKDPIIEDDETDKAEPKPVKKKMTDYSDKIEPKIGEKKSAKGKKKLFNAKKIATEEIGDVDEE